MGTSARDRITAISEAVCFTFKPIPLSILGALILFGSSEIQGGQEGFSRNVVGFSKVNVPSNSLVLASNPFHDFGTNQAIAFTNIFDGQLSKGFTFSSSDNVDLWDEASQAYLIHWKNYFTNEWRVFPVSQETTNRLPIGEGMLLANNQSFDQEVYLFGEVPDAGTTQTAEIELVEAKMITAYPFPSAIGMNDTTLTDVSGTETGDLIRVWDIAAQDYVDYFYDSSGTNGGGWQEVDAPGSPTTRKLKIAEGFWFNQATNGTGNHTWTESKPYTWP